MTSVTHVPDSYDAASAAFTDAATELRQALNALNGGACANASSAFQGGAVADKAKALVVPTIQRAQANTTKAGDAMRQIADLLKQHKQNWSDVESSVRQSLNM